MAEHSTISDPQIHEPKGVSSASEGEVYVSDGVGSGNWSTPYLIGVEDYNDVTTTGTPIALTSASTDYPLTNDAAGSFTNTTYKLPGATNIWNPSTNQFEFATAGLELGDTVDFRVDIDINNSSTNGEFLLSMELAIGGTAYTLPVQFFFVKSSGVHNQVAMFSVYMGDTNTLNNPARFVLRSDSTSDTVTVNGWYVRSVVRTPRFV